MKPIRSHHTAAFTLLEIMLVVMIIALLAGAAIHFMGKNYGIAADVRVETDIKNISTQLMLYQTLNGSLPSTQQGLDALVQEPTTEPKPRKWKPMLDEVPTDPWGNAYVLEVPARRSKRGYDLYSKGPDGQANTEDDQGNWK